MGMEWPKNGTTSGLKSRQPQIAWRERSSSWLENTCGEGNWRCCCTEKVGKACVADAGVDLKSSWLWWLAKTKARWKKQGEAGGGKDRVRSHRIPLTDLIPCQAVHWPNGSHGRVCAEGSIIEVSMPKLSREDTGREIWTHELGVQRAKIVCTTAWARSVKKLHRTGAGCWHVCLSRHKVRQNMSIHEGEKAFKIDSENGPWVSKGQTGESKVEKRIKSGMCWRRGVHVVNGTF